MREPSVEDIDRELARRCHLDFMQWCWMRKDPLVIGRHTRAVCEIVDDAIRKFRRGVSSYLAIKIPFRHGKSDMVSRYLPAHFAGEFPDNEAIVAAYNSSLVRTFSRASRSIVRSANYQQLYPRVKISSEKHSLDEWGIEGHHGTMYWVGIGGGITGKGGSLIIVDDFFKNREEAESEVIREKVWESIRNDILTRCAPVVIVIILATPWHVDDPFGRIQKEMAENPDFPRFEEIKFPAKSDRYENGYLFSERFSKSWYDAEFALLGPYSSAGLLQCDPMRRGGNLLRVDKIQYYDEPPAGLQFARGWDLASTEKQRTKEDPDFTAGVRTGVRWIESGIPGERIPILYIDDVIDGQWEAPQRNTIIRDTAIGDGHIPVGVEAFAGYKDAATTLEKVLAGLRIVHKKNLPGDKLSKWSVLEPIFAAGNVYMRRADWNDRVIKQLSEIPGSSHDDIADALVVSYESHNPFSRPVWKHFNLKLVKKRPLLWRPGEYLHYAGLFLSEDLRLSVVAGYWSRKLRRLYVYGNLVSQVFSLGEVARILVTAMKLNERDCHGLLGNHRMFSAGNVSSKTTSEILNEEFISLKKRVRLRKAPYVYEPMNYDRLGAMQLGNLMWQRRQIEVHPACNEAVNQFATWYLEEDKPAERGFELCEALCLFIGELDRIERIREPQVRKPRDYNRKTRYIDTGSSVHEKPQTSFFAS